MLTLVAGCESDDPPSNPGGTLPPGTSAPTTSAQPSTPAPGSDGENIGTAPRVPKPLDTARFEQAPCGLLTETQLAEFGGGAGTEEPGRHRGGKTCYWRLGAEKDSSASADFYAGPTKSGLSDVYVQKEQGNWAYFEPTEVAGYPAAFVDGSDNRDDGACSMSVGVREDLYLDISTQAPPGVGRESCTAAENLAAAMIKTLGG